MQRLFWENYTSFYFIGIGGVSMSALAKFMLAEGKIVGGSDNVSSIYTEELHNLGANVEIGKNKGSVSGYDIIIYTDAVSESDLQLSEARKCGKIIISRGQFLYEVSRAFKKVIGISGCHGKTTCVSMLAHIFSVCGKRFCAHIGGRDKTFCNFYYDGNDYFLTEACEYKKNFLLLKPDISVILNSGSDHLECYGSEEKLREAYFTFAKSGSNCVSSYSDLGVDSITFGFDNNADFSAHEIICDNGFYSFSVLDGAVYLGKIKLNVYGKHNILNALAAIAVARIFGFPFDKIAKGLGDFFGVERRFEYLGKFNGAKCIADYAHHPDEIAAAVQTADTVLKGRLFVIFQPHTYSRTKNLFSEFTETLSCIKNLLIYRTFAAREYFDDKGSALTLSQALPNACYGDCPEDIVDFLKKIDKNDLVLFLGAGDIYDIAKSIISGNN